MIRPFGFLRLGLAVLILLIAAPASRVDASVHASAPSTSKAPADEPQAGDATTDDGDQAGDADDETAFGRATIEEIMARLKREAMLIADGEMEMPEAPDFAERFGRAARPSQVESRMIFAQDRDPFIDAYVRWQLTSYDPALREMNEPQFRRLLIGLPALRDNPMADRRIIRTLDAVLERGRLNDTQAETVDALIGKLDANRKNAQARNRAALGLRAWIIEHHPEAGLRPLQLHIERVSAYAAAGWPADSAKQALEACCVASAEQRDDFTVADRRKIAVQLQRLLQQRTLYLETIERKGDQLILDYDEAAVDDFEVNRWLRIITP